MSHPTYESDRSLNEYLLFHYGTEQEIVPFSFGPVDSLGFAVRSVHRCIENHLLPPNAMALDLGCAVGRSSFELARFCSGVVGIDASRRFIDAAKVLQADAELPYWRIEEGELATQMTARVPREIDRDRVRFEVGDAMALDPDLPQFDVVHMANLIDRLPDPERGLAGAAEKVRPGGQLILTSPYTWLVEFTPRERWLGGRSPAGEPRWTFDQIRSVLAPRFSLSRRIDLPFLIREHARKYQWSVADASVWIRHS